MHVINCVCEKSLKLRALVRPSVPAGEAERIVAHVRVACVGERAGALLDARAIFFRASASAAVRAAQHLRRALPCVLQGHRATMLEPCMSIRNQAVEHQHMQFHLKRLLLQCAFSNVYRQIHIKRGRLPAYCVAVSHNNTRNFPTNISI